jgi:MFS family permease
MGESQMTQALAPKLVRRLVLMNALTSFLMGSMGFSIQLIKRDFDLTRVTASWHNIGWAGAMVLASVLLLRVGSHRPLHQRMRNGWFVLILGSVLYCLSPNIYFSVPAVALTSAGAVLVFNTAGAALGAHSKTALKNMFRTTGVGLFMGSVSPTLIGVTTQIDIPWRLTMATTAIVIGVIAIFLIPEVETPEITDSGKQKIIWNSAMLSILGFAFLTILMEIGLSAWALDLLIERGAQVKTAVLVATIAPYFVASVRIYLSFKKNHNLNRIWAFMIISVTCGVSLIIFTNSPTLTLVGLIVAAIGIGPGASIAMANASASNQGPDRGVAVFVVGMGLSNGASPWVMGFVSENWGFEAAYVVILVALVISSYLFVKINRKVTI